MGTFMSYNILKAQTKVHEKLFTSNSESSIITNIFFYLQKSPFCELLTFFI